MRAFLWRLHGRLILMSLPNYHLFKHDLVGLWSGK